MEPTYPVIIGSEAASEQHRLAGRYDLAAIHLLTTDQARMALILVNSAHPRYFADILCLVTGGDDLPDTVSVADLEDEDWQPNRVSIQELREIIEDAESGRVTTMLANLVAWSSVLVIAVWAVLQ